MKHAILILSHKGINYIKNTIKQFGAYDNFNFFIHIDKKCNYDYKDIFELHKCDNRIKYVCSLYNCEYLKFNLVEAELHLLDNARKYDYDYYHLFSEQCRIICSPEHFLEFFEINNNIEFIECRNAKISKWETWRIYDESINHIYYGQQWWSLTNNAIKMIFSNKLHEYIKYYRTNINVQQAADEVFFQNIIIEYENDLYICYGNDLRYVDWERPLIDNMHPKTITKYKNKYNDIHDKLIIRKIDFNNSDSVDVLNKIRSEFNNNEIKKY